jgi:L-lactate dehydrogenase complex protein LldG
MKGLYRVFASRRSFEAAQRVGRSGARFPWLLPAWTKTRDLPDPPSETFRAWWKRERGEPSESGPASRGCRLPPITRSTTTSWASGDARGTILGRIREALADGTAAPEVPRHYRRQSDRPRHEVVETFAERAADYRATVVRAAPGELHSTLVELAAGRRLAVPPDLPADRRLPGVVEDRGLTPNDLDGLDGVLTGCALAIAETGALVLDGGPGQGRRALTLVPDYHLCVVDEASIVDLVPEAVERLQPAVAAGRPLTFIAGPSATSDIELERVEGVHGPRTLHIVIA